jgi:glycosyltransferase involved in cell wall biosynthesis
LKKLRIGINTRFLLSDKLEGFGWYTYEVTKRMVLQHPEIEFYFFFDRKYDPKFVFADNVKPIVLNPPARHPILFKLWFNYSITKALKKHKIDLFFSPDGYLSLKTKTKQIGVIHDLNFEHFPGDIPKSASKYLKKYFPLFAQKASQILTVSEFSKKDIIELYGIQENKITVAYNGINTAYNIQSEETKKKILAKYCNGKEFTLFVGSIHPRKNLKRLLEAFDNYKKNSSSELKLIVAGDRYWWTDELKNTFENLNAKEEIIFTGHLQQPELVEIMGSAKFLSYVSYFEGFGLPVGEAMQSGTPVLAASKTSIPEVGGEAALYIDPYSVEDITKGIQKLDNDDQFRNQLIEVGLNQAKKFNWDITAEIVWNTLMKEAK